MEESLICYYCEKEQGDICLLEKDPKGYICNECKELLNSVFNKEKEDERVSKQLYSYANYKKFFNMCKKYVVEKRDKFLKDKGFDSIEIDKLNQEIDKLNQKLLDSNKPSEDFLNTLNELEITKDTINLISKEIAIKFMVIPVQKQGLFLLAKMYECKESLLEELSDLLELYIIPIICPKEVIQKDLSKYYSDDK